MRTRSSHATAQPPAQWGAIAPLAAVLAMGAGFATASVAQAAPVAPAASPVPLGACSGDPGPFVDVTVNYGNVFHDGSPEYTDYNGTRMRNDNS